MDDTEMGVLLYNLAVLAFLKKDFLTAEKLVRRVSREGETITVGPRRSLKN